MPDLVRQFVHGLFLGKTDEQTNTLSKLKPHSTKLRIA